MTPAGEAAPGARARPDGHAAAAAAARPGPAPGHPAGPRRGRAGARGARRLIAGRERPCHRRHRVRGRQPRARAPRGRPRRCACSRGPAATGARSRGCAVEIAEGDLLDARLAPPAVAGARHVYHVAADYRLWAPDPRCSTAPTWTARGTCSRPRRRRGRRAHRLHLDASARSAFPRTARPGDETTPVSLADMVGPYKASKFLAEQVAARACAREGLPVVIVNPSAPIGPWDVKPTPDRPDGRRLPQGPDVRARSTRGSTSSTCATSRAATSWPPSGPDRRKVHPRPRQSLVSIEICRTCCSRSTGVPRAARSHPVRGGLARRRLHGSRGARHGSPPRGAAHRGPHGPQAHVLQPGQGRARARPAADPRADGARRGRRVVHRARLCARACGRPHDRRPRGPPDAQEPLELLLRVSRAAQAAPRRALRRATPSAGSWTTRIGRGRGPTRSSARALDGWRQDIARCYEPGAARASVAATAAARGAPLPDPARRAPGDHRRGRDGSRPPTYETSDALYPVLLSGGLRGRPLLHRDLRLHGSACARVRGDLGTALQLTNILRDVQAPTRATGASTCRRRTCGASA